MFRERQLQGGVFVSPLGSGMVSSGFFATIFRNLAAPAAFKGMYASDVVRRSPGKVPTGIRPKTPIHLDCLFC